MKYAKCWFGVFLGLVMMISGCSRFKRLTADSPASSPDPQPANPTEALPSAPVEDQFSPEPDFTDMTFVEKNNLYLQLLTERQSSGGDTNQAEETYARSLEASLNGNAQQANQYQEQAILLLWNQ